MTWGAIGYTGRTPIAFLEGMEKHISSSDFSLETLSIALKNSGKYQKLIEKTRFFMVYFRELTISYISTSSTTSTLRLPLYILSVVSAYQKAYGTGKRVMMVMVVMVQGTYVL